ncbi:MAG: hypothetical protein GX323_03950 [Clostridiales bacterium]|nr:hypothetical protein [Clostridiales bacterium]
MRKIGIFMIVILALVLGGCSSSDKGKAKDNNSQVDNVKEPNSEGEDKIDNFAFKYNNIEMAIDDEAKEILDKLGEPMDYFEAPSCAYQGLDRTYYYNGFEITTYAEGEVEYIASILLVDDTVTTDKGVYIGSSVDDVIKAHGEDYEVNTGQFTYTKGDSQLQFIFKDDYVVSILYTKII